MIIVKEVFFLYYTACPAGTYRDGDDIGTECKPCPTNTHTDVAAASYCECLPGFFRDNSPIELEGPDDPCKGMVALIES